MGITLRCDCSLGFRIRDDVTGIESGNHFRLLLGGVLRLKDQNPLLQSQT
jgi:hypothetical protein